MQQTPQNKAGGRVCDPSSSVHGDTGRAEELIRCRMCCTLILLPYGGGVRCHLCGHETNWLGRYSQPPRNSILIDDILPASTDAIAE